MNYEDLRDYFVEWLVTYQNQLKILGAMIMLMVILSFIMSIIKIVVVA